MTHCSHFLSSGPVDCYSLFHKSVVFSLCDHQFWPLVLPDMYLYLLTSFSNTNYNIFVFFWYHWTARLVRCFMILKKCFKFLIICFDFAFPTLTYGCETLISLGSDRSRLQAVKMDNLCNVGEIR